MTRTARHVHLTEAVTGGSIDYGDGLDFNEEVGCEQCGHANECAWCEQGDPEFRAGACTAFLK